MHVTWNDYCKTGLVSVVVPQQVHFNCLFGLTELSVVEELGAEFNDRRVQREKLVFGFKLRRQSAGTHSLEFSSQHIPEE